MTEYALEHLRGYDKVVIPDDQHAAIKAALDKMPETGINAQVHGHLRETRRELVHLNHNPNIQLWDGIVLHRSAVNFRLLLYIDNPRICPGAYIRNGDFDEDNVFSKAAAGDASAWNAIFQPY